MSKTTKTTRKSRKSAQPTAGPSEALARFLCRLPREQWADVRSYATANKLSYMGAMRTLVALGLKREHAAKRSADVEVAA